jgi:DNA-directed RNA polymerase specialized sigma24 family protein
MPDTNERDKLRAVKRAAKRKQDADDAYRTALLEAAEAGLSYADIARTLGTSRQRVRQLLTYRARSS